MLKVHDHISLSKNPNSCFVFLNLDQTIKQRQKVVDLLTYRKDYSGLQSSEFLPDVSDRKNDTEVNCQIAESDFLL